MLGRVWPAVPDSEPCTLLDGKYQKASHGCQPVASKLVDSLLAAIEPWRCVLCRGTAHGMDICADCMNDLPWLTSACRRCAVPLPSVGNVLCGSCMQSPADIDHCVAALVYDYPVDRLIGGLKYQGRLVFARALGELLAVRIKEALVCGELELPDALIPVPMHRWRLVRRTCNHADEIARWLNQELGVPVENNSVQRIRNTPCQTSLSRAARLLNMRGAFRISGMVQKMRIALVDDVITTGATIRELARRLKREGAAEVQVWAVARTRT